MIGFDRSTARYRCRRPDDASLRRRLRVLAAARRRFGYRRLGVLLAREGLRVNHKKLYRLYRSGWRCEGAAAASAPLGTRRPMTMPQAINERWSLDFASDALSDGRRFRVLCVLDDRECPAPVVDTSISGKRWLASSTS